MLLSRIEELRDFIARLDHPCDELMEERDKLIPQAL